MVINLKIESKVSSNMESKSKKKKKKKIYIYIYIYILSYVGAITIFNI